MTKYMFILKNYAQYHDLRIGMLEVMRALTVAHGLSNARIGYTPMFGMDVQHLGLQVSHGPFACFKFITRVCGVRGSVL